MDWKKFEIKDVEKISTSFFCGNSQNFDRIEITKPVKAKVLAKSVEVGYNTEND